MRLSFLLFLAPGLKLMAKPLQTDLIIAPSNYIGSELDLDDAGTSQNTLSLLSPLPTQYIESSHPFRSAPILDIGTNVNPEFNLEITGIHQGVSSLSFSRPVYSAGPDGFERAEWPYTPYCPIEFAYCCTGDYAPETNKFVDGCSPCMPFSFLLLSSPLPFVAQTINVYE